MIVTLEPEHNYSAVLRGWNSGSGVGLVELYDLSPSSSSRIYDISTRGITTRESPKILDAGVIVSMSAHLVVRALGPTLVQFGVGSALRDPNLFLYNANGAVIAANDNWRSDQEAEIIATGIPPANDLESAIVALLPPANYTAIVRGANNTTGIALVEVYALN